MESVKQTRRSRQTPQSTEDRNPLYLFEHHLIWLEMLHRHGDLPTAYLYEFTRDIRRSLQYTKVTLRDLYHEHNTHYPTGEKIGKRVVSRHPQPGVLCSSAIYTKNPITENVLKTLGRWHSDAPEKNLGQWQHDFFGSIIRATMHLAAKRDGHEFHFHDEIVEDMGGYSFPVEITWDGATKTVDLVPDPAFGITFPKGRITFLTEVDCNSEPVKSNNLYRKSLWRSAIQYEHFIGRKQYKQYLNDGGLLVANIFTNETRMRNAIEMIETQMGGCNYMLFKYVPDFDKVTFRVPKRVLYEIYDSPFLRPGRDPLLFSSLC